MLKKNIFFIFLTFISLYANNSNNCTNRKFNIISKKGSRIEDFINQIVDVCHFNLIIGNSITNKILRKKLNRIYLKNATLTDLLNIFLDRNNLFYELKKNTLEISFIKTKTYSIDYIASERIGSTTTTVNLGNAKSDSRFKTGMNKNNANLNQIGSEIISKDKFNFWGTLHQEIYHILNRPEDNYKAKKPIINKKAGLITVSATLNQLKRVEFYLKRVEKRLQKQVLIDVHIFSVKLNNQNSTGIDWSQFYNDTSSSITHLNKDIITKASINQIIRFLQDKGKVSSVSNPKILSLNNQPALISVGNELFYKERVEKVYRPNSSDNYSTYTDQIKSVFAGILLDITPEISDDNKITLKINPSISQAIDTVNNDELARELPPDMTRKQLSTVVTTANGKKIILGGLINTSTTIQKNVVPLLGYIPIIGGFFKSTTKIKTIEELVIIITPHIIKNSNITIKELDYKYLK